MRFVDRKAVKPPPYLAKPDAEVGTERTGAQAYYLPSPVPASSVPPRVQPSYGFKAYGNNDVRIALDLLFKGKCAYCEGEVGAQSDEDIEHYRPKAGVKEDAAHSGYWWLASDWRNLLLSCQHCNQSRRQHIVSATTTQREYEEMLAQPAAVSRGKLNQFPIAGKRAYQPRNRLALEKPLLIDPTATDPKQHLMWVTAKNYSLVVGKPLPGGEDPRGAATVAICTLNRVRLVRDRTALLNKLRTFREKMRDALNRDDSDTGVATALDWVDAIRSHMVPGENYTALAAAYAEEVAAELDDWLARRRKAREARARIQATISAEATKAGGRYKF